MEHKLILRIKGGILGIKNGTKTPQEVGKYLIMLEKLNRPMYEDLMNDYKAVTKSMLPK